MQSRKTMEELVANSVLASPPDILFKIINSLESELNSRQIGEIIGHDQSISAQVLKLSNSSFFGFKGNISTLDRAINILGIKTVRNIAVTSLLYSHTHSVRLWNLDIMNFWLHAFLVADISREIAQKCRMDTDTAYIAGLLHDIGKLILYSQKQDKTDFFTSMHNSGQLKEYEVKTWGFDSLTLTCELLKRWNIPDQIVSAISDHRSLSTQNRFAKVIAIANEFGSIATDFYFRSSLDEKTFMRILNETGISDADKGFIFEEIPLLIERCKMIMKIMSKKHSVILSHRNSSPVTLISASDKSFAKCILDIIGIRNTLVLADSIAERENALVQLDKLQAELVSEEKELGLLEEQKKGGLISKIFKPKTTQLNVSESFYLEKQKKINALRKLIELKQSKIPGQVNWTPVVIFDHIPPFRINKKGITIYQTGSAVQEKTIPGTLPFIFNSHDLKPQN